ncbi:MAG: hypothetical protein SOR73_12285 [Romboutsia timonensis]|uniref:hypothetical protein n=1 Tax=Romboutsia timonensis TaxID=1776391 RepID=UPI002A749CB6|nr:hypothetical protein [Romboutsia timonensis]MDY3002430.1 hypothetical protein [Romboutsia timonensis]
MEYSVNQIEKNERNLNIDLLRIICAVAVVIIHVNSRYVNDISMYGVFLILYQ